VGRGARRVGNRLRRPDHPRAAGRDRAGRRLVRRARTGHRPLARGDAVDAAQAEGVDQLKASPVARNSHAIDFFHSLGFTALGHVDLLMDFRHPNAYWQRGERVAGRDFDV
jgi:hypothetical protein